jgi:hypothetical protein
MIFFVLHRIGRYGFSTPGGIYLPLQTEGTMEGQNLIVDTTGGNPDQVCASSVIQPSIVPRGVERGGGGTTRVPSETSNN